MMEHKLHLLLICTTFGITTIGTMLLVVSAGYLGLRVTRFTLLERFANCIAGFAITGSGLAIELLGI